MAFNLQGTVNSSLAQGAVCLVASFLLLYVCDVPSSDALDAPIWQAVLLDGDDADPSEAKSFPLPDNQPGFASASRGTDRIRVGAFGHSSGSIVCPRDLLLSSIPMRAPPEA
jgi:hypothetical protein